MKINLIIPSFYPAVIYGGPIFSTLYACQELVRLDDIEIYVSTTNANMDSKLDVKTNIWTTLESDLLVKYYNTTIKHTISLPMFFLIWRDIRKSDVVHLQSIFSISTVFSLIYALLQKKQILLSPRGQLGKWCVSNGSSLKNKWLRWFIKPYANKVTWHATAKQEKLDILNFFPEAEIDVIPNGIKYDLFQKINSLSKDEFTQLYAEKKFNAEKIIVSMARLHRVKGFDILINAFVEILMIYPHAKLFIAGEDAGEREQLLQQIAKLELQHEVFLIGVIDGQEKIDFLANADIFVLPSHNENFGNVYVESLAAGTPVVASTNAPWKEVEEANCGIWVNNSIKETARAMLELLQKDRETMRANARALAKKYDWKNIAFQFKDIYTRMIQENAK